MRMFIPIVEVAPSEKPGTGQNSMAKTGQFWVAINRNQRDNRKIRHKSKNCMQVARQICPKRLRWTKR